MAEIQSFPNNKDEFIGAEAVMKWLHGRTSGVFAAQGKCAVSAVPGTMSVEISDGEGWLSNREGDGIVWWVSTEKDTGAKLRLTAPMADAALPRIDRVIISWPTTNYADLPEVKILAGTPASDPVPPALRRTNLLWEISLARIYIPAGADAVSGADITDERLDDTVCGLVTESVAVDTGKMQERFDSWFGGVRDQLDGDVAGNLLNQINALRESAATRAYADSVGILPATHSKAGTVHNITAPAGARNFRFVTSAKFNDGDTVAINGVTKLARFQNGEVLGDGAWDAWVVVLGFDEGDYLFKGGSGKPKPTLPYLYKPGNECWVTTGGWDTMGQANATTVIERRADRLSISNLTAYDPVCTNRFIPFPGMGFKTLKFQYANNTGYPKLGLYVGTRSEWDSSYMESYVHVDGPAGIASLDISKITADFISFYPAVASNSEKPCGIDILKVWLE